MANYKLKCVIFPMSRSRVNLMDKATREYFFIISVINKNKISNDSNAILYHCALLLKTIVENKYTTRLYKCYFGSSGCCVLFLLHIFTIQKCVTHTKWRTRHSDLHFYPTYYHVTNLVAITDFLCIWCYVIMCMCDDVCYNMW